MTIKDIIFLKSVTPITLINKPSATTEFVARFMHDFQASDFLINTRKQFGLPENGIDITPFVGKNLLDPVTGDGNSFYGAIQLIASSLQDKMGVDNSVIDQMVLLIFLMRVSIFVIFQAQLPNQYALLWVKEISRKLLLIIHRE